MKSGRFGLTIGEVFALSMACLVLLLSALFYVTLQGSRQSIMQSSDRLREVVGERIAAAVEAYLGGAEDAAWAIQTRVRFSVLPRGDERAIESTLFATMLEHQELTEFTLTYGRSLGYDRDGRLKLAAQGRGQIAVYRTAGHHGAVILTRHTFQQGGRFVSEVRQRPAKGDVFEGRFVRDVRPAADPTLHLTFRTPSQETFADRILWSDLHWTQLDAGLPEKERRVVVTVQKSIEDTKGEFFGVIRAGLDTRDIDQISRLRATGDDQHRIFICDNQGRLVTRLNPGDPLRLLDDKGAPDAQTGDLRVVPRSVPLEIRAALSQPSLATVDAKDHPTTGGRLSLGQSDYLYSFRALNKGQDWIVGIVVPESYYLGGLVATRHRLLGACLGIMLIIVAGGILTWRTIRHGLHQVVAETDRMRLFEFGPTKIHTPLRDISAAMESLELAKTALRALGKYVPIGLVRQLYQTRQEPTLGSERLTVSIMFTDIKNFTGVSEEFPSTMVAQALGRYLEVMTRAIHDSEGTVDKYVGDAIMALWNAPHATEHHARKACQAALDCIEAARALYASDAWAGHPAWVTRFGLHRAEVNVGHFGAPDRINYTAIGDGVDLASRLEGLNKHYGTVILCTAEVYEDAREFFEFRHLDRVAVIGKRNAVEVYELLGRQGQPSRNPAVCSHYEQALEAYFVGDFTTALRFLSPQLDVDPPSAVLYERCTLLSTMPLPPDWTGVFTATHK